jgi:formylglycine-generating enzyme required for sulfatase activity
VLFEINEAFNGDLRVIPLRIDDAPLPAKDDLPESIQRLATINAFEIETHDDFENGLNHLLRSLRPDLGGSVRINSIGMKFMPIKAGEFLMGEDDAHGDGHQVSEPFPVRISNGFRIGVYPVTQREFTRVTGRNPSFFFHSGAGKEAIVRLDDRELPVESVTWDDALEFCNRLSTIESERFESRSYRLPTEAEWEYACREPGERRAPFSFGETLSFGNANFDASQPFLGESGYVLERTSRVGSYARNASGLYDMHGNVWEWCADWYEQDYFHSHHDFPVIDPSGPQNATGRRVVRGGSWNSSARYCQSGMRSSEMPYEGKSNIGFRVVCEIG